MIPLELANQLVEIEENVIRHAAEAIGDESNTFRKLLYYGEIYRKAGLNPIYLTTPDYGSYAVSCEETFRKRLN